MRNWFVTQFKREILKAAIKVDECCCEKKASSVEKTLRQVAIHCYRDSYAT